MATVSKKNPNKQGDRLVLENSEQIAAVKPACVWFESAEIFSY